MKLYDSSTYLSDALLQCLRTWKEQVDEAPLTLSWEDIDQLYTWINTLQARAEQARQCLEQLATIEASPERLHHED